MPIGYLTIHVFDKLTQEGLEAHILVEYEGSPYITTSTNNYGAAMITLETVPKELSLHPNYKGQPFALYACTISKNGYQSEFRKNISIFEGQTSMLYISMIKS